MMHTLQNLSCERGWWGEMGVAEDHEGMLIMEKYKNIRNGHGQSVSRENRFE